MFFFSNWTNSAPQNFPGSYFGSVVFRGCLEAHRPPLKKGLSYSTSRIESFVDIMIRFSLNLTVTYRFETRPFFENGDISSYLLLFVFNVHFAVRRT